MKRGYLREKYRELLVILICGAVLLFGILQKEGYHMDELLSFEFANARFNPWIVPTQPQGRLAKFVEQEITGETFSETLGNLADTVEDVLANKGSSRLLSYKADVYEEPVWITGEQFTDYITVGKGDAFSYLSVYFNVKDDNHPPLHFMALHTISSLFPGKIAPIMGCIINLGAVLGILILLIKLGEMLASAFGAPEGEAARKGRTVGLLSALLYGLSTGAAATVLLIRMYAMVTFFCVALFYLCLKKWQERGFEKKNGWLIAVTVLGFWTQYFFLFYCIVLIGAVLLLLIKQKRLREVFCLIRSMVIAAVLGLIGFPFAVSDVFSSGRGVEALENLSRGFSGYGERLGSFLTILAGRTFGILSLLFAAVFLVFLVSQLFLGLRKKKDISVLLLLVLPPMGYFFLAARMSPYLVDRYIMPLFPFVILGGVCLAAWGIWRIEELCRKKGRRVPVKGVWILAAWVLIAFRIAGLFAYDGEYLYKGYRQQEQFAKSNRDLPCICIYEGVGYYENLLEFAEYEKTLLVKPGELAERKEKDSIRELDRLAVIVKPGVSCREVETILQETYGFQMTRDVFPKKGVHGDRVFIFEKNQAGE